MQVHQTGNGIECPVNMSRGPRRGETPEKEGRVQVIEIRMEPISRGREIWGASTKADTSVRGRG